jgi:hypothetical protein
VAELQLPRSPVRSTPRTLPVSLIGLLLLVAGALEVLAGIGGVIGFISASGATCDGASGDECGMGIAIVGFASIALAVFLPIGAVALWLGIGVLRRRAFQYWTTVVFSSVLAVIVAMIVLSYRVTLTTVAIVVAAALPALVLVLPRSRDDLAANRGIDDRALWW